LTINSLYGGVKLSQEADMVILLQADPGGERQVKFVEVVKNRWDGVVGAIGYRFDEFGSRFRALCDGRVYDPYPNRKNFNQGQGRGQSQIHGEQQQQQQQQQTQPGATKIGIYEPKGEQQLRNLLLKKTQQLEQAMMGRPMFGVGVSEKEKEKEKEKETAGFRPPKENWPSTSFLQDSDERINMNTNTNTGERKAQQTGAGGKRGLQTNSKKRPQAKNIFYFKGNGKLVVKDIINEEQTNI